MLDKLIGNIDKINILLKNHHLMNPRIAFSYTPDGLILKILVNDKYQHKIFSFSNRGKLANKIKDILTILDVSIIIDKLKEGDTNLLNSGFIPFTTENIDSIKQAAIKAKATSTNLDTKDIPKVAKTNLFSPAKPEPALEQAQVIPSDGQSYST
jgi:hypothetical protein